MIVSRACKAESLFCVALRLAVLCVPVQWACCLCTCSFPPWHPWSFSSDLVSLYYSTQTCLCSPITQQADHWCWNSGRKWFILQCAEWSAGQLSLNFWVPGGVKVQVSYRWTFQLSGLCLTELRVPIVCSVHDPPLRNEQHWGFGGNFNDGKVGFSQSSESYFWLRPCDSWKNPQGKTKHQNVIFRERKWLLSLRIRDTVVAPTTSPNWGC